MASSSVTQNPVAEDGSLSPRNWPVKENNRSINSIIVKNDMMLFDNFSFILANKRFSHKYSMVKK